MMKALTSERWGFGQNAGLG